MVGEFDEESYLHFNPDVAAAVFAGGVASAREHWIKYGRAEDRTGGPLVPLQNLEVRAAEIAKRPFGVNLYGFLETKVASDKYLADI